MSAFGNGSAVGPGSPSHERTVPRSKVMSKVALSFAGLQVVLVLIIAGPATSECGHLPAACP